MNEIAPFRAESGSGDEAASLPHSVEAEQQLLGAILTNNDTYDRVSSMVGPQHFYEPVHARIFEIAANRISKNALASPVTLKAFMEEDDGLKELGGPAYLARLAGAALGVLALQVINLVRVGSLYLCLAHGSRWIFDVMHEDLWQLAFLLLAALAFAVWVRRLPVTTRAGS